MRKIRWGVLGTAAIACNHTIPGMIEAENCELYAIAGRSMEKAKEFQEKFGFQKAYDSYEALLEDPEVEAVYIPLPNTMHYEWAIRTMQAGKHVLCEKPLAPTPAEIKEMIQASKDNNVILMEAFAYLHSPIYIAIRDEIQSGAIGDVLYMDTTFMTSDYDISNIRMRRETAGGSVYDLGCYCTSVILWMLGQMPSKIKAVGEFSDQNIDKLATGYMVFEDGKKATFTCGMLLATDEGKRLDRFQIHGTKYGFV